LKRKIDKDVAALKASPPARGRGLKLADRRDTIITQSSPPARGRGLKQESRHAYPRLCRRPPRGGVD